MACECEISNFVMTNFMIKLRPFQIYAIRGILEGKDIFVAVPTGTGKTLCYSFLPQVADMLRQPAKPSLVVVVSPLLALMDNQIQELSKLNIRATHLGSTQLDRTVVSQVLDGHWQLLFLSPELALNKTLRKFFRKVKDKLVAIVVDEAHCIDSWGEEDFRPCFKQLGQLRAIVPDASFMALTATVTNDIRRIIFETLIMTQPTTLHILPDRPNITYNVIELEGDLQSNLYVFDTIVESLISPSVVSPKIVIYCSTVDVVSSVYAYFKVRVPNAGTPDSPVLMFHKTTSITNKSHILEEFPKPDSVVRVVICTIAFGLGINVPDISHVINFGAPCSLEDFVQESGRAGRDGSSAVSTLYHIRSLLRRGTDEAMLRYCSREIICRRKFIAQHFRLNDYVEYEAPEVKSAPQCCDMCNTA